MQRSSAGTVASKGKGKNNSKDNGSKEFTVDEVFSQIEAAKYVTTVVCDKNGLPLKLKYNRKNSNFWATLSGNRRIGIDPAVETGYKFDLEASEEGYLVIKYYEGCKIRLVPDKDEDGNIMPNSAKYNFGTDDRSQRPVIVKFITCDKRVFVPHRDESADKDIDAKSAAFAKELAAAKADGKNILDVLMRL